MQHSPSGVKIPLLDKGFIQLLDYKGSDLDIVRAARVKPLALWREAEDPKLIRYMLRNHHSTPFEHVVFTFWVKAPIFVYRQWHRHRTQSYNEQSARYQELDGEFYVPQMELIGEQSNQNHQARSMKVELSQAERDELSRQINLYESQCATAYHGYQTLLAAGWPRELARMCLPVSIYSEMTTTVNLRNLFHFLSLRDDSHAQHEIKVYAQAIINIIRPIVPQALAEWEALRAKTQE